VDLKTCNVLVTLAAATKVNFLQEPFKAIEADRISKFVRQRVHRHIKLYSVLSLNFATNGNLEESYSVSAANCKCRAERRSLLESTVRY